MEKYDLIIIGAGSGGLTAAEFAVKLGIRVALVEKDRIGGDCTWTGCVPSKALLKAAKVAHAARTAMQYGIHTESPKTDMAGVKQYIHQVIADVYAHEEPETLIKQGIDVISGTARFIDSHTIDIDGRTLYGKKFIIATGAHPVVPPIPGLSSTPYQTYLQLFDNDQLPERFIIIGAGPIGAEIAQAYQRLGSQVTLIDTRLLPSEAPEVAEVMGQVFEVEGIHLVQGLVSEAGLKGNSIVVSVDDQQYQGDLLLVAVGRRPNIASLGLKNADINSSPQGIEVNDFMQTSVNHIYAIGDCVKGNLQFTHVAGWQGVQAVRNAFLPLNSRAGSTTIVPWSIFTDPEVAHVGLTEVQAREAHGDKVHISDWPMTHLDRAVAENDYVGFIKVVHLQNGKILGATIVAERAGELISEFAIAIQHNLKLIDIANVIHPYPTYAVGTMQLAGEAAVASLMNGTLGKVMQGLARVA